MRNALILSGVFFCLGLSAGEFVFECAPWRLAVSDRNGAWRSLRYKNTELLNNPEGLQTINLNTARLQTAAGFQDHSHGEAAGDAVRALAVSENVAENPVKLVGHQFDAAKRQLTLDYQFGPWQMQETVSFGVAGKLNRICRKASFVSGAKRELKFKGFQFLLFLPLEGRYYFPGTFFTDYWWREDNRADAPKLDWHRRKGELDSLPGSGNDRVKFIILSPRKNLSLILFADSRLDGGNVRLKRNRENIQARWQIGANGWALPGKRQQLAGAYLEIAEKDEDRALHENCPALLRDLGFLPPADRPEWVKRAIIYGLENEPFRNEILADVPRALMPRIKFLGANTVWLRPSEASTGRYSPIDYKVIEPKIGTAEDYRRGNETLHRNGIRVLQDLVPHGGTQLGYIMRGQSIRMMSFTENGGVLNNWSSDFNDPGWKRYMHDVCRFYAGELKTDGFRIDAIYGSKTLTNWRKENWPASFPPVMDFGDQSRQTGRVLPSFWENSLKKEGGKLPALAYERGSLASSYGGLAMNQAMRSGAREGNPEAAVLLESGELPFTAAGDLHYDRDIQSCWFKLRGLTPADFVAGLRTWLDEEQYVDTPGTIRMRYMETGTGESWNYRRWYGLAGDKAIRALCTYIHGVPMVYEYHTLGEGVYLQRLFLLRKNLPALNSTDADYLSVKSSAPEVFTVLRPDPGQPVATVINFSANPVTTTLTLPSQFSGNLVDLFGAEMLGKAVNGKLAVSLPPFGNRVIAAMPEIPVWAKRSVPPVPKPVTGHNPVLTTTPEFCTVKCGAFEFSVSRRNGQLTAFNGPQGAVLAEGDLLKRGAPFTGKCIATAASGKGTVTITAEFPEAKLVYTAYPDHVEISGSGAEKMLLALSFPKANAWEIDTFEGRMADVLPDAIRQSSVFYQTGKIRDVEDYQKVWHSAQIPLDWNSPAIRALSPEGDLTIRAGETTALQALYQGVEGKPMLRYTVELGGKKGAVQLALYPQTVRKADRFGKPVVIGKNLVLSNVSTAWRVENGYYCAELLRSNGVIRSLKVKAGKKWIPVLENQNLTAGRSLFRGMPYAAASMDPGTLVKLERQNGKLHLQFTGELRSAYAMSSDRLELVTDYYFDDSPEIRCEYTLHTSNLMPGRPEILLTGTRERFPRYLKCLPFSGPDAGKAEDLSRAKKMRIKFFSGMTGPLLPRTGYRFAVTFRTDGKAPAQPHPLAAAQPRKLAADFGFEARANVFSAATGKKSLLLAPDFDPAMPWKAVFNAHLAPEIGRSSSAGFYLSWCNPVYQQEVCGPLLASGKYRLGFDLKSSLIKVPRIREWSEKLMTVHPFLKKGTPVEFSLEYRTRDGKAKKILRKWTVPKEHDWQTFEFTAEVPETAYAPVLKFSATPEYAGELFLDNLQLTHVKERNGK